MQNKPRVVVTGLGVISPNGIGISNFTKSLFTGVSGVQFYQTLKDLHFSCQVGGVPFISEEKKLEYFTPLQLRNFNSNGILYGVLAGMEAIQNAGIVPPEKEEDPLWDLGIVFGVATSGVDKFRESIYQLDEGNVRRLGSTAVAQTMASGVSAYLSGMIGAGNSVTTNSAACATGTEAILLGYERIVAGKAKQMLCGSTGEDGPYIWGGFDAMKVTTYKHNDTPREASRPMSETASGFVPGSGAGALLLESLESAEARGATIYAEVLGGAVNSGGQRGEGSMTAPNSKAVIACIKAALQDANITGKEIDYINGHLTATTKDALEVENWCKALDRSGTDFPYINSLKGMVGHCLAASGSIEAVSTILQMQHDFVFPNVNCNDIHPEITNLIAASRIPRVKIDTKIQIAAKASFGFGDVNACVIFKKN
ncbi:beta-ketoacyl-[acyl-carrier-protein] synthase family protein [Ulvibacter litoralis]|uniref:3-oxoacyl-[acyl-carrier-protein] synthase 1 n=1 Tax=Ulvibacter litoralis TaxID=227084 RepID=A0A1G7FND9_9FLAO|nr:beta-ketoacyl-[acyl-carrier-protein] synthase family protein [Ulvibacter litoralis]GHC50413.1 beta-ketoacyl-ACP synthase [Ulvibacter litoralis]SDE77457.1 3-oxoacyl-(acyl-carrier-protein) synthase [Ulvibacter litoralis]